MRTLTPEEVSQIQNKGGGAVLRKLQAVEKKIKKTHSTDDEQEYDSLVSKCLQLIAVQVPASSSTNETQDVKYPEALVDEINAMVAEATGPIFDAWNHGILDNETAKSDIQEATSRIVSSRIKRYKQLFYLRRLSQNQRTLTIRSKILGADIILGPAPSETNGMAVYSYDEVIALVEDGTTEDPVKFKELHAVKVAMDGDVLPVKSATFYQRSAWDKDDGQELKAGSVVGGKAALDATLNDSLVNPDEEAPEISLLEDEGEDQFNGNEGVTIDEEMEGVLS